MVCGDWEVHGGWEPHLSMSLWAACLCPPGHPGTVALVLGATTLSPFASPSVLPKFEMTVDLPAVVLEKDKKFQMEVCGR